VNQHSDTVLHLLLQPCVPYLQEQTSNEVTLDGLIKLVGSERVRRTLTFQNNDGLRPVHCVYRLPDAKKLVELKADLQNLGVYGTTIMHTAAMMTGHRNWRVRVYAVELLRALYNDDFIIAGPSGRVLCRTRYLKDIAMTKVPSWFAVHLEGEGVYPFDCVVLSAARYPEFFGPETREALQLFTNDSTWRDDSPVFHALSNCGKQMMFMLRCAYEQIHKLEKSQKVLETEKESSVSSSSSKSELNVKMDNKHSDNKGHQPKRTARIRAAADEFLDWGNILTKKQKTSEKQIDDPPSSSPLPPLPPPFSLSSADLPRPVPLQQQAPPVPPAALPP